VDNPRDEFRANEEIQTLQHFLDQLVELNKRLAALEEVHESRELQDEKTSKKPPDSQPPER
jgi:hypothetical protein